MSAPALSAAFFDPERRRYGMARAGATLLFDDTKASALEEGAAIEPDGDGFRASAAGRLALELAPVGPAADLGGVSVRVCRVTGEADGRPIEGLGTVSQTDKPPSWDELDALRAVSILVDEQTALLLVARRPRGALGHGAELTRAALIREGELLTVEDARLSTVYDADGRQRSAGLELWVPGEDFPRRASGSVAAGSSLELEGLRVHAAVFRWRLEEREGIGQYELAVRSPVPEAA